MGFCIAPKAPDRLARFGKCKLASKLWNHARHVLIVRADRDVAGRADVQLKAVLAIDLAARKAGAAVTAGGDIHCASAIAGRIRDEYNVQALRAAVLEREPVVHVGIIVLPDTAVEFRPDILLRVGAMSAERQESKNRKTE